jgi:anti-sigma-K factor RskA
MTPAEDHGPEHDSDDLLAAEFVLGALEAAERQSAARRIETDADFARLVDDWEVRLSPMAAEYPDVEAPASVKAAIDRRLFASDRVSGVAYRSGLWSNLSFWRGLAAIAVAATMVAIAVPYMSPSLEIPQPRLVASLAADGSDVKYLAVYDAARHEVGLSHVSGERASGKDFELWMIEGTKPPVSMGIIPPGATTHVAVSAEERKKLAQGAVLAISLESAGGSPTGQPTGPVVAAGDLKRI